mmetsp:Transcript_27245/g.46261  ORF Transcript_27245/g.46261 Transcript_27245/m.46261 type:complete len:283 (+) Transcript_27245:2730-3578(+)
MHLQRVQQPFAHHDDLLGLLLDGEGPDQRRHLLGRLPLRQLAQPLLPRPDASVDHLQEQLPRPGVEDEQRSVDGLRGQVPLERLVDGHTVHVGVVHEPDDLVGEELPVILRGQVGLRGLGGVQLQALADALPEHVEGRVGLHDLGHGLPDQRLHPREPVAVRRVQVVRQVHADQEPSGAGVDGDVVGGVVEELGAGVALDVVGVVIAPAQLHVDPVLRGGGALVVVFGVGQKGRGGHLPLVGGEEEDVGARRVHFVGLARVDGLFLDGLDLQRVQFLVEDLA